MISLITSDWFIIHSFKFLNDKEFFRLISTTKKIKFKKYKNIKLKKK
jgi:hypothetical protein